MKEKGEFEKFPYREICNSSTLINRIPPSTLFIFELVHTVPTDSDAITSLYSRMNN